MLCIIYTRRFVGFLDTSVDYSCRHVLVMVTHVVAAKSTDVKPPVSYTHLSIVAVYGRCTVAVRSLYSRCMAAARSLYGHCWSLQKYVRCTVVARSLYGRRRVALRSLYDSFTVAIR